MHQGDLHGHTELHRKALRHATSGTGLDPFLNLRVTRGTYVLTEPAFDSCGNFVADLTDHLGVGGGVIYDGTLQAWADDYSTGHLDPSDCLLAPPCSAESWTDSESHVYRFEISLQDNNSAQGLNATQAFTWEARDVP